MRIGFFWLIIIIIPYLGFAQEVKPVNINGHADCISAMPLKAEGVFGPTTAPEGYGKILEFVNNPDDDPYFFEKEHHTVWYKFMIPYSGYLVFEIIPENVQDDYDFSLYRFSPKDFCKNVKAKKILPVRTNIARNDLSIGSKTGLSLDAQNKYKDDGPGSSYSKAVKVKKNDIYYLVLDNVYDNGGGHRIEFKYLKEDGTSAVVHEIKGKIQGHEGKVPGDAEVVIQDIKTGEIISTTKVNKSTGEFKFEMPADFNVNKKYNVSVFAEDHFFKDIEVVPSDATSTSSLADVKLDKLRKGKNYKITNIVFYSDSPQYLPESEPVLKRLLKLMQDNPNISIEIEGHINGCTGSPEGRQILSEARARTVHDYLERNGIEPERMTTVGYGCRKMIYPNPKNKKEMKCNRRVEIKITNY